MQLVSELIGDVLVVRVNEVRIDAAAAVEFKDAMRAAVRSEAARVVLDLSKVTMIDSSGLGAIVTVMKHLGADTPLELAALSENVANVFRLTRMDTVMKVHPSVERALATLRSDA